MAYTPAVPSRAKQESRALVPHPCTPGLTLAFSVPRSERQADADERVLKGTDAASQARGWAEEERDLLVEEESGTSQHVTFYL